MLSLAARVLFEGLGDAVAGMVSKAPMSVCLRVGMYIFVVQILELSIAELDELWVVFRVREF